MVYNGKPLLKWMIWGYHHLRKHPHGHASNESSNQVHQRLRRARALRKQRRLRRRQRRKSKLQKSKCLDLKCLELLFWERGVWLQIIIIMYFFMCNFFRYIYRYYIHRYYWNILITFVDTHECGYVWVIFVDLLSFSKSPVTIVVGSGVWSLFRNDFKIYIWSLFGVVKVLNMISSQVG